MRHSFLSAALARCDVAKNADVNSNSSLQAVTLDVGTAQTSTHKNVKPGI